MLTLVCRTLTPPLIHFKCNVSEKILIRSGQKIKSERTKQGMPQEKLAEKAGVHRTYIGMIERVEKKITLLNVEKISDQDFRTT